MTTRLICTFIKREEVEDLLLHRISGTETQLSLRAQNSRLHATTERTVD